MYMIIEWPGQRPTLHEIIGVLRGIIRALSCGKDHGANDQGMIWRIGDVTNTP